MHDIPDERFQISNSTTNVISDSKFFQSFLSITETITKNFILTKYLVIRNVNETGNM